MEQRPIKSHRELEVYQLGFAARYEGSFVVKLGDSEAEAAETQT